MSKAQDKPALASKKHGAVLLVGVVLGIALLVALVTRINQPERSVAAYCKVYGQEKARLGAMSNKSNPYPSGLFDVSVVDAAQIATSLGRLDHVAPTEIEPALISLRK